MAARRSKIVVNVVKPRDTLPSFEEVIEHMWGEIAKGIVATKGRSAFEQQMKSFLNWQIRTAEMSKINKK